MGIGAGVAGSGISSYIDNVLLRDKDTSAAWTAAASATLNERRYMLQNWRADVTTMVNTAGEPIEWYRYTAYGQPTSHPIADVNGDGVVNSADAAAWLDLQSGDSSGSVWLNDDLNRDDAFPNSQDDDDFFNAQYTAATSAAASGYDRQSAYGLRKGYAGYEWDDTLAMWHVRHRVLDSKSGKWTKRDPLGYVDGMSDVEYVRSRPQLFYDPDGRQTSVPCENGDPSPSGLPIICMCPDLDSDPELVAKWNDVTSSCRLYGGMPRINWKFPIGTPGSGLTTPNRPWGSPCNVSVSIDVPATTPAHPRVLKQTCQTLKTTLIHELEHVRQACAYGLCDVSQDWQPLFGSGMEDFLKRWNNEENALCRELEAYCRESPDASRNCKSSGRSVMCGDACNSVGRANDPTCVPQCKSMERRCTPDGWVFT